MLFFILFVSIRKKKKNKPTSHVTIKRLEALDFNNILFVACPTTFDEFYNQRRRWMPSTIMNILDLLADYKSVINANQDISIFYILYQVKQDLAN